jgi:phosphatidylserine decarboxylase
MPADPSAIVSPADAKVLVGSFADTSRLFLKEKFFCFEELFGRRPGNWAENFQDGDFCIFRLTPDKYHYNHTPVAGNVSDIYEISGSYHSCNPGAVVTVATPYSKNKRVVTIIDTDVEGGTQVGLVAMIEVVALMIGDIQQCYSEDRYDHPKQIEPSMFLKKGCPKSLYRPGSSVDVLVFQKDRIVFSEDILANMYRYDAQSRYTKGFGRPLVETDVQVRSEIARRLYFS